MDKVNSNRSNVVDRLVTERQTTKNATDKKTDLAQSTKASFSEENSIPDYVVSVTAEKIQEKSTYTPEEVRAKARAFLAGGTASPEEQRVLSNILEEKE